MQDEVDSTLTVSVASYCFYWNVIILTIYTKKIEVLILIGWQEEQLMLFQIMW